MLHTCHGPVYDDMAVIFLASHHVVAVHQHAHQLGLQVGDDVRHIDILQIFRVELNDVLHSLHQDGTVVKHHHLTVLERLVRHIIVGGEIVDEHNLPVVNKEESDAARRGHPHIVILVFDDGMHHLVVQPVGAAIVQFLASRLLDEQTQSGANPFPAAAVACQFTIRPDAVIIRDTGISRRLIQHSTISHGPIIRPRIGTDRQRVRTRIEYAAFLSTYPQAALMVEGHRIAVGSHRLTVAQQHLRHMLNLLRIRMIDVIAIFRWDVNQLTLRVNCHIVQVMVYLHHRLVGILLGTEEKKDSSLVAVTDLEEAVAKRLQHGRA